MRLSRFADALREEVLRVSRAALWISARLSRAHPLLFLAAYLAAIPLFAALYTSLPKGTFFAPYAKYEPGAHADTERLHEALKTAIRRALGRELRGFDSLVGLDIAPDPMGVRVSGASLTDTGDIQVNVVIFLGEFGGRQRPPMSIGAEVCPFDITIASAGLSRLGGSSLHNVAPRNESQGLGFCHHHAEIFQAAFLVRNHLRQRRPETPTLELTPWQEQTFIAYIEGSRGEPAAISGIFGRMTYFSISTLTTVGFGDIVPLTSAARSLAGVEAVLGWTLAGLFLNSFAARASGAVIRKS